MSWLESVWIDKAYNLVYPQFCIVQVTEIPVW
jgi:hypothetical protein